MPVQQIGLLKPFLHDWLVEFSKTRAASRLCTEVPPQSTEYSRTVWLPAMSATLLDPSVHTMLHIFRADFSVPIGAILLSVCSQEHPVVVWHILRVVHLPTLELRFQFRYSAPQPPRLLKLDPQNLWFSSTGLAPVAQTPRHKVEPGDVTQALSTRGGQVRYSELRQKIMQQTECSKRTAQLAISQACKQGSIIHNDGQYRLPL
jgi:hypothetical protein